MLSIRMGRGEYIPPNTYPREVHVEVTSECNLNCEFCYRRSWDETPRDMDLELYSEIIDQLESIGTEFVWLSGWGEPTYHKNFPELLEIASGRFRLGILTNGVLLGQYAEDIVSHKVEKVVVSVDSLDPEKYGHIRVGSELESLFESIKELKEEKKRQKRKYPSIWFIKVLMKSNLEDLPEEVKRASEIGAVGLILSNLIPTQEHLSDQVLYGRNPDPKTRKVLHIARGKAILSRIKLVEPEFEYRTDRFCPFVGRDQLAINRSGDVSPCLFALHNYVAWIDGRRKKINQIKFGNVMKRPLVDIWWDKKYAEFRAHVELLQFPSCNDCPYEEFCDMASSNELDCWGNSPSCAACPYYRRIVLCPRTELMERLLSH
ncbi:MAG: hypothetical protein DRO00_07760 [Thermoproteota archaeon]|nr:MAG: hypothetical protein DRO00_07760 [Candidatus Korarchaeota archaeon]